MFYDSLYLAAFAPIIYTLHVIHFSQEQLLAPFIPGLLVLQPLTNISHPVPM